MGSVFSYIIKKLFRSSKELKLMIVGLDSSGKSSILSKIKGTMGIPETKPTIGYDLEEVKFKKVSLRVWDLSGQEKVLALQAQRTMEALL
jgi:small GTP-binding protein